MSTRRIGRRALGGGAVTLFLAHLGYQVAQALASPLLGMMAANLLFVLVASLWASVRGRGRPGPR